MSSMCKAMEDNKIQLNNNNINVLVSIYVNFKIIELNFFNS